MQFLIAAGLTSAYPHHRFSIPFRFTCSSISTADTIKFIFNGAFLCPACKFNQQIAFVPTRSTTLPHLCMISADNKRDALDGFQLMANCVF